MRCRHRCHCQDKGDGGREGEGDSEGASLLACITSCHLRCEDKVWVLSLSLLSSG